MYENGAKVDAFEDHITEIGVHGKPHKIFPFIQSNIEKNIISLATVQAVLGTSFRITGVGTPAEASELALLLRAGALAAPMKFVEERTVGPSLGKENIELGMKSIMIGFALVVLFGYFVVKYVGFAYFTTGLISLSADGGTRQRSQPVSYTHLTLPTKA